LYSSYELALIALIDVFRHPAYLLLVGL